MDDEFDAMQESADAIRFGYPLKPCVREELGRWLEKDRNNPFAQRVAHLINVSGG